MTIPKFRWSIIAFSIILITAILTGTTSAATILSENPSQYIDTGGQSIISGSGGTPKDKGFNKIRLDDIERARILNYIAFDVQGSYGSVHPEGSAGFTYSLPNGHMDEGVCYVVHSRNVLGQIIRTRYTLFFYNWDIGALTGAKTITINRTFATARAFESNININNEGDSFAYLTDNDRLSYPHAFPYISTVSAGAFWQNKLTVESVYDGLDYQINLQRVFGDAFYGSTLTVNGILGTLHSSKDENDIFLLYPADSITNISIKNPTGSVYTYTIESSEPEEPTVFRTGTVTMTDNNGTTITGFDVTAINHYTGAEYNVTTDTDVAVMTLPMDRTIEIRNPQTGAYEEAPVGYYRFFGQSPGYRMLHEDGIKVSVMPEKYGSYQLCDIRVTSESGYLTGTHQFQIRSRSDNSILQSGTISAKSATTGEWYNATVSGGIASLILPYDTSNSISQYAGKYYVYATSPGYEDSDYGTQIVVMPHTVSEIRDILLTPIGGIPTPGNVTLRIQVFSETGPGIPNAEIFVAGVLGAGADVWNSYTASSTGYLTVSVPGNSTYDIVASGTGYYDSAHRVEVFDTDPALIEIKLYLSGAPTVKPTTQPTGWVTPTPTQTSSPIQEDNIIGLSVKGLAKGFGIDYDTALLMFGLMIIFGAGGMVMSSVKGGAMEFIAGSIVGTFVAFALGLIPIWIFIIIVVVFGAYVLRVFVQGGQ